MPETITYITLKFFKKIYWFLFVYDLSSAYAVQPGYNSEPWKNKLKRDVTGLILFSYIVFIFNPLVPIFADMLAHTFWEKEHLAAEHKLHGSNHLYNELTSAAKQTDKDKSANNTKSDSDEYVHLVSNTEYYFSNNYIVRTQAYNSLQFHYPDSHPDNDYPPPRA